MSPPKRAGGEGRSRDGSGVENVGVSEEEKLTQPCFEGYLKGAWWEIDILERRSDMFLIRYVHHPAREESWVSLYQMRLRARKCDDWDCAILRRGVDVSVYSLHPPAELRSNPTSMALYDAKIVSVTKSPHQQDCCCRFFVQYFAAKKEESSPKHGVERSLLKNITPEEVTIARFSILQQPGITPLHEVIKAHISGKWDSEQGRWSNDALFLKETELRIFRGSTGEESMANPQVDVTAGVESDQDLETPPVRSEAMNGHELGGSKAPRLPVQETTRPGSRNAAGWAHNREKVEVGRGRNSPAVGMRHAERGVKRKHDFVDEKEISNVVQEDYSPGVNSRFARSNEKIAGGARRQDQDVGQQRTNRGDIRHHAIGKGVEPKKGRKLNIPDSESSPEDDLSDKSEERIVVERGGHRDGLMKRGRTEENYEVRKLHEHRSARHDMHKSAEQGFKSRSYGTSKNDKFSDKVTGRRPVAETEQGRPSMQRAERGSFQGDDLKLGKSEEERGGRRRGRPRGVPNVFKYNGGWDYEEIVRPKSPEGYPIKSKHSMETELKKSGTPVANVESPNSGMALRGSQEIDAGLEGSKRGSKGKHGPHMKLPDRAAVKRSSDRLQKVSDVKHGSTKDLKKKERDKADNDPGLAKSDAYCSTSSPNSEDPASEPGMQHRKLRPRSSGRSKKSQPRNQSDKIPSGRLQKDAEKEKSAADKAMERPLYMDLFLNNSKDNEDGDNPRPVEPSKPDFGLNDNWDPIVDDVLSDSDCNILNEEDPLIKEVWQDIDSAVPPAGMEQGLPLDLQDDSLPDVCIENILNKCEHNFFLKDDVGLVCDHCGLVSTPIEEMVPQVDCSQRRPREADLDEWDLDRRSPDIDQGATGYDELKKGEVVTMLHTCLPPHYGKAMHAHQKEGFEFLWRNLAHTGGQLRSKRVDKNAGCILSHAPGTGKSFLIIAFLKSYMDKFPGCQPLIVAPKIMLLRWEKEFATWKSDIRVFILNTATVNGKRLIQKHEESGVISLKGHQVNSRVAVDTCRMAMLYEWKSKRSVCLVSYNLFSALTDEEGSNKTQEREAVRKSLLESTGILILDEGHFPRNKDTRIRKALMKVKTNARILLSGTLFQNNFEELFNTLYLVRPGFVQAFSSCQLNLTSEMLLNEIKEKPAVDHLEMEEVMEAAEKKARKLFVEEIGMKIEEGQHCQGSEVLQHGLQRLQRLTSDFVHHHTGEVLASLPGLRDFGILLKPTALQCTLLELVDQRFQKPEEYLKREIAVSGTSIHPNLLTKLEFVKSDMDVMFSSKKELGDPPVRQCDLLSKSKELTNPEDGVKTKFVFDLLRSLKSTTEKVLIFSQHISPLELLEDMFKTAFNWEKHKDVLRLDGKMPIRDRESVIERFNNPYSKTQVLLASTKACGEGINLVGASRVVFLDVLWNPAVIKQAISRAFRLGQKKTVYVYRLIAFGTIEEKKYKKAIRKDWLSMSIFSPAAGEADISVDAHELSSGLKNLSPAEEIRAWEVDATTCEDDLLEKLLNIDKDQANSFLKVVEHGSRFHNRKTSCGPDAREWFLEDWDNKDLSQLQETSEGEELGMESTNPENLASKLYQDFGEIGAFDVGAASSSDTDEEIL